MAKRLARRKGTSFTQRLSMGRVSSFRPIAFPSFSGFDPVFLRWLAELHWYEGHGKGRKETKIKKYLE